MIKLLCVALSLVVLEVSGHGMMLDPPNRSSLWRFDDDAPVNYNDNENFCGGIGIHWGQNGGLCGVCGDNYVLPHPQPNENTGLYGTGKIAAEYQAGQVIETGVKLTANHKGYFEYYLCQITDSNTYESGEDCFKLLEFEDGTTRYPIVGGIFYFNNRVKLPNDVRCEHCVLRWHYKAGNNWGTCEDGSQDEGCGPQEFFRSCTDIRIN